MGGTKRAVEQLADGPSSCLLGSRLHADDFSALYRHYVTPLYRYFHYQVAEVHQAEDLTASTLLRAFESRHRFEGRSSLGAWLFGIARNVLREFRRRHRSMVDLTSLDWPVVDPAPLPEASVLRSESERYLCGLVQQLPASQREAITLRYFGGLHLTEIAAVIGRSEGAVKLLLHRALVTLRARYDKDDA